MSNSGSGERAGQVQAGARMGLADSGLLAGSPSFPLAARQQMPLATPEMEASVFYWESGGVPKCRRYLEQAVAHQGHEELV